MDGGKKFDGSLVFAAGFVPLFGQGVLYRDFLGVFGGWELSTGAFLAFWLLWIGAGSLLAKFFQRPTAFVSRHFELALLAYLPALFSGWLLITNARVLAGVERFENFDFERLLMVSGQALAPLSLLTGVLFVAAARRLGERALPAARVYALESLGSCAGALLSTLLLSLGLGDASLGLFAAASLFALLALAAPTSARRIGFFAFFAVFSLAAFSAGPPFDAKLDAAAFARIVPDALFKKAFHTAQGRYLLGERAGEIVVARDGSVVENYPDEEASAPLALLAMAEAPRAKKIMVAGFDALSLCAELAKIPQVESVVLCASDPDYPEALLKVLPERHSKALSKIGFSRLDPLALAKSGARFDLAIVNPGSFASIASARFSGRRFIEAMKEALGEGVLLYAMPKAGAAPGPELLRLQACLRDRISDVFRNVVVEPDEFSLLIAGRGVSDDVGKLVRGASSVEGLSELLDPESLRGSFGKDRVKSLLSSYAKFKREDALGLAPAIAHSAKLAGAPRSLMGLLKWLAYAICAFVALYCAFRLLSAKGRASRAINTSKSSFDATLCVFLASAFCAALFLGLLARFQIEYGNLAIRFGLLNALFLGASFLGAFAAEALKSREKLKATLTLLAPFQCWFAAVLISSAPGPSPIPLQAALCGFLCGWILGLCCLEMKDAGLEDVSSATRVELLDCLGGALGGLVAALALIPFFGFAWAKAVPWLLFLALLPLALNAATGKNVESASDEE